MLFKFIIVGIVLAVQAIFTIPAYGQGSEKKLISLDLRNVPIRKAFDAIEAKADVVIMYENTDRLKNDKVSINVKDKKVGNVLDQLLSNRSLKWNIRENIIRIEAKDDHGSGKEEAAAPPISIKWQLFNVRGEPVAGATVVVKGKRQMAISNEAGIFTLENVDAGAVLIISSIAYSTMEVPVAGRMENRIGLALKTRELSEVSVTYSTGYQTISKERSAGSFAKPEMKQFVNANSASNLIARLDGLVPGLTINNRANAPAVLIRGLTTINSATAPLIVVDGLPVTDISTLNFNDVADITVLKDATASSIWGARAANGVITILTKAGRRDNKLKIDYDVVYTFKGRPNPDYLPRMNSQEFVETVKEVYGPDLMAAYPWTTITAGAGPLYPHEQIMYDAARGLISTAVRDTRLDSLARTSNFDQAKDLWYRSSLYANHSLAVSAGGKVYSFRGALSYTNNMDATPGDHDNAYNLLLRNDLDFGRHVKAYLITQLNTSVISSSRPYSYNPMEVPYVSYLDDRGNGRSLSFLKLPDQLRSLYETQSGISLDYNPVAEVGRGSTRTTPISGKVTGGITINLIKGLRLEGVYGYQRENVKTTSLDNEDSYTVRQQTVQFTQRPVAGAVPVHYLPVTGANFSSLVLDNTNWTIRNQLVYDNSWKDGMHQLTALLGQEAQDQLSNSRQTTLKGYDPKLLTFGIIDYNALAATGVTNPVWATRPGRSQLTAADLPYRESETELRFNSYYANVSYSYKRRYIVNGSTRMDQSNLFGKDHSAQNKPVWSAGVAWNISHENFMSDLRMIDRLALRATYGLTGNSPAPGTAASYDIVGAVVNGYYGNGLALNMPANGSLTWETTKTFNVGVDFALNRSRLSGSIDFYKKNTYNLIGILPLNVFTGFTTITGNYGNMTNNGIELSLNSINLSGRYFSWRTGLVLGYNKNKITRLLAATPVTSGAQLLNLPYVEGYSAYALFAYHYAGLDNHGDPLVKLADGTISHNDVATTIRPADMVYAGTYQPIWNGGLSNTFTFMGFSISANIVYNLGSVMRRNVNNFYSDRILTNLHPEFAHRWKKPGDELITDIPSYVPAFSISSVRNTDYYTSGDLNVVSASFIKLRDLNMAYNVTPLFSKAIKKVESVVVRAGLSNVMLWKNNKYGIDPEFQGAVLPINQHQVTVGAHVTF